MSTFVSVGNARQPFGRLLHAVDRAAAALPQPVIVQNGHTPFASVACRSTSFFEMTEFDNLIATAELVIMQAGGGGVLSAFRSRKVPIIVPRRAEWGEHVDNHQVEWGRAVAGSGRALLLEDLSKLVEVSANALSRQRDQSMHAPPRRLISLVRAAIDRA